MTRFKNIAMFCCGGMVALALAGCERGRGGPGGEQEQLPGMQEPPSQEREPVRGEEQPSPEQEQQQAPEQQGTEPGSETEPQRIPEGTEPGGAGAEPPPAPGTDGM
nr:MAG: hypothetical protein DIU78_22485 [Pseudomonadota bacterium]